MQTYTDNTLLENGLTFGKLRSNVQAIQTTLSQNTYHDSPPPQLIAVTKNQSPLTINALKELQIMDIGENKVQIATKKMQKLDKNFQLHWIGRLQSNKVRSIIDSVCMIHTLDRISLVEEVNRRAGDIGRTIPSLVQINIAGETQKGGLAPEEARTFLQHMHNYPHVKIMGLMSIMPLDASEDALTSLFARMRILFDTLRQEAVDGVEMKTLSMGMSMDYALAARQGATMVRIGTALFKP